MATPTAPTAQSIPRGGRALSWRQSRRARTRLAHALAYTIVIIGAIVVFFPFYWQISTSLKAPEDLFRWPPVCL